MSTYTINVTSTEVTVDVGVSGPPGIRGPQGVQGPIGVQGPVGPEGPEGPQGERGPMGYDSTVPGPQGAKGDKGDTGAASTVPGPVGPAGPQGPQGVEGARGSQGHPGIQGIQGPIGPQGLKGDTGDRGTPGPSTHIGPTEPLDADVTEWIDTDEATAVAAPLDSPLFTGDPRVPTPAFGDRDFSIANTQWAAERAVVGNLLTANQASVETDAAGWAGYLTTVARSTAQASDGAASLLVTLTAAGGSAYTPRGTSGIPVRVGLSYTFVADVRAASATPSVNLTIGWFTAAGALISQTSQGYSASTASWVSRSFTYTAPATAAYAAVEIAVLGSTGNAVYIDRVGFWAGAGGDWQMPGVPIPNLGTRITRPNTDDRLIEQWNPNKAGGAGWSIVDYDSGWRDITGIVTLPAGVTWVDTSGTRFAVRRVNDRVRFIASRAGGSGTGSVWATPSGFSPENVVINGYARETIWEGPICRGYTEANQYAVALIFVVTGNFFGVEGEYPTNRAIIPTSLPGTLVSAAPA